MAKSRKRHAPLITALEPRMLLDGAALTEANQTLLDAQQQQSSPVPDVQAPVLALSQDPAVQVIVIDASVPSVDQLLADIPPEWTVVRLNADSDGLTQLNQALQDKAPLAAIHIFSHGSAGRITLGNLDLTTDNMASHSADLVALGQHLTASGDLMIYGCNVAAAFAGQQFVNQLADITQADVAASEDATGSTLLGGNWSLESQTGLINTATINDSQYNALLSDMIMSTGEASDTATFKSTQWSPRLYWQASGAAGYGNTGDTSWVDQYTTNQDVKYWGTGWYSISYPVFRWGWLPWTMETAWYSFPTPMDAHYGSGTRYATEAVTLTNDSIYQFDVTANAVYKDNHGQILTNAGITSLNTALYKGAFDPTNPLKNLVTASEGGGWFGTGAGQLSTPTIQRLVSNEVTTV